MTRSALFPRPILLILTACGLAAALLAGCKTTGTPRQSRDAALVGPWLLVSWQEPDSKRTEQINAQLEANPQVWEFEKSGTLVMMDPDGSAEFGWSTNSSQSLITMAGFYDYPMNYQFDGELLRIFRTHSDGIYAYTFQRISPERAQAVLSGEGSGTQQGLAADAAGELRTFGKWDELGASLQVYDRWLDGAVAQIGIHFDQKVNCYASLASDSTGEEYEVLLTGEGREHGILAVIPHGGSFALNIYLGEEGADSVYQSAQLKLESSIPEDVSLYVWDAGDETQVVTLNAETKAEAPAEISMAYTNTTLDRRAVLTRDCSLRLCDSSVTLPAGSAVLFDTSGRMLTDLLFTAPRALEITAGPNVVEVAEGRDIYLNRHELIATIAAAADLVFRDYTISVPSGCRVKFGEDELKRVKSRDAALITPTGRAFTFSGTIMCYTDVVVKNILSADFAAGVRLPLHSGTVVVGSPGNLRMTGDHVDVFTVTEAVTITIGGTRYEVPANHFVLLDEKERVEKITQGK